MVNVILFPSGVGVRGNLAYYHAISARRGRLPGDSVAAPAGLCKPQLLLMRYVNIIWRHCSLPAAAWPLLFIRLFAGRDAGARIAARLRARGERWRFCGVTGRTAAGNAKLGKRPNGLNPDGVLAEIERERAAFVAAQREEMPPKPYLPPLKAIMRMPSVLL